MGASSGAAHTPFRAASRRGTVVEGAPQEGTATTGVAARGQREENVSTPLVRGPGVAPAPAVRVAVAVTAATFILAMSAAVAAVAAADNVDLTGGCTLQMTSTDAQGGALGSASGPGTASPSNPFLVDPRGRVEWTATAPAITNATYSVSVYSIPILSGDFANESGGSAASGTLDLSEIPPLSQLAGIVYVSGSVTGDGGTCSGAAWVKLNVSPLGSVPGVFGLLLGVLGIVGIAGSVIGSHPLRGLGFGVLLGLGLGLLSVAFGFMPLGQWTPVVCLVAGPIIGGVLGALKLGAAGGAAAAAA